MLAGKFGPVLIGAVLAGTALIGGACGSEDDETGGDDNESYRVPSESMEPTLEVGEDVSFDPAAYEGKDPAVEDIIVFHPPLGAELGSQCGVPRERGAACSAPTPEKSDVEFVKRIVAGPGDTLAMQDGHPVVDGIIANEDFVEACRPGGECTLPRPITIPPEHYFVLGDNRGESDDSRFWGPIPRDWIIGKVDL